jgi:hypothetical protein
VENLRECIDRVSNLSAYATYKEKLTNTFGVVVECDAPRLTSGPGTVAWQLELMPLLVLAPAEQLCCSGISRAGRWAQSKTLM